MSFKKFSKKKVLNFIVFIVFLTYVLFGTDFLSDLSGSVKKVSGNIKGVSSTNINSNLYVYFIDVGQADSILIKENDKYVLIDAGNNEDNDKLVSYFKSLGIQGFDYVIATHAHEDHIGGMDDIINNFKIDNFYMPSSITSTKTFEDVLDALLKNNLSYDTPYIGKEFVLNNAKFEVIYVGDSNSNLNDTSIVLRLDYGENSFLFTGDATSNVEQKILDKNINVDVLKVGHHGSSYSTKLEFLNKVAPKYCVISVGKDNIYNHPSDITINNINNKCKIYRTDLDGTIIFSSDGKNINIKTEKTDTNG